MNVDNTNIVEVSDIYQMCTFVLETPEGTYLVPYPREHGEIVAPLGGLALPFFHIPVHCFLPMVLISVVPLYPLLCML